MLSAASRATTAPTLVSVSESGMYQNHPASNAQQRMLPEFGGGSRFPPSK
jgi:hypothetical protein